MDVKALLAAVHYYSLDLFYLNESLPHTLTFLRLLHLLFCLRFHEFKRIFVTLRIPNVELFITISLLLRPFISYHDDMPAEVYLSSYILVERS